jgi:hypothetical protein
MANSMAIRRQVGRMVDNCRYQKGIAANDPRIIAACGSTRTYQRFANGDRTYVTYPVVSELCGIFEAEEQFKAEMVRLWKLVDKSSWTQSLQSILASGFDPYLEFEQIAVQLDLYQTIYVVGLFQTEAYMRRLFSRNPALSAETIERLVQLRLLRQEQIEERGLGVTIRVLMHETALRSGCDGAQIARLQEADERDNFTIMYLPFESGPYAQLDAPFNVLSFTSSGGPDLVYLDNPDESRFVETPKSLEIFSQAFESGLLEGRSIRELKL